MQQGDGGGGPFQNHNSCLWSQLAQLKQVMH